MSEQAEQDGIIVPALGSRSIVLIGLMGAGKTTVGRRLAKRLNLPFVDADHEIEAAAGEGERRVIGRLLFKGPQVLATGGGAYMDPETRRAIREHGISVWLKADLPVLMKRVRKRGNRPLLANPDPEGVMQRLMEQRYPVYADSDITVESREVPHDSVVDDVVKALAFWLREHP
jgi:shikimate kinase